MVLGRKTYWPGNWLFEMVVWRNTSGGLSFKSIPFRSVYEMVNLPSTPNMSLLKLLRTSFGIVPEAVLNRTIPWEPHYLLESQKLIV